MKVYKRRYYIYLAIGLACIVAAGCSKDFLNEKSVSRQTADSYFTTAEGLEDLVRSCYPLLRDIHQERWLVLNGTDIFTGSKIAGVVQPGATGDALDQYDVRLNSSLGSIGTLWELLYREIGRANAVVATAPRITDMPETAKAVRVGEAKFLRALCLFYAVQQWGDIPMPLEPVTSANRNIVREKSAVVYSQIIGDLLECEADLPVTASDYGRITKGAAQFLLSRVYLTRGWNFRSELGGSDADFTEALKYADKIIAAYPLCEDYKLLWPQHSENPLDNPEDADAAAAAASIANTDKRNEIIFAVQYSADVLTYTGDPSVVPSQVVGNNLHSRFGGGSDNGAPGEPTRNSQYNRNQSLHITTPATYRLFDPQLDSRYGWNFVDVMIATSPVTNFVPRTGAAPISFQPGDTVIVYKPWNQPALTPAERGLDIEGGTKKYSVINTDEFGNRLSTGAYRGDFPFMWKFWQPGISYGDGYGTDDEIIFRSAEAYLIAAEAILKGATGGALGGADVYYNKVLDRALGANAGADPHCAADPGDVSSLTAASYRANSSNLTIDMILDERARELMGEYSRWFDLKRTGKLIERTKKYNPWTALNAQISDKHYLRPIPQSEIDLSSPTIEQNTDY
ncbi:MAG: RagB/SusD family nutrient uptake outer membrane protein [Chitinophagaceae bacterium]|nr:RagB/SusD family nutrient uptake outer membrane protein [Chitinophagaceae bacterium]